MSVVHKTLFYILCFGLVFTLSACDTQPKMRQYTEVVIDSPLRKAPVASSMDTSNNPELQKMIQESMQKVQLSWNTPKSWIEEPGSGMRLATFKTSGKDPILCTIVSLGGSAGGRKANIVRWLQQINITDLSDLHLRKFMELIDSIQTEGELKVDVYDFTTLQDGFDPAKPSMVAGIIDYKDKAIFIKMTGSIKAVQENLKPFKELCQSLTF